MATPSNVTATMSARQGLAFLNDARKLAPLTYTEHAQCDEIFARMDEAMAAKEAAEAREVKAVNESTSKGETA